MSLSRRLKRKAKLPLDVGPATASEEIRIAFSQGRPIKCRSEECLVAVTLALKGQAVSVRVLHDQGCSPLACRCSPEFVLEALTPERYLDGQRAQAKWAKESLS